MNKTWIVTFHEISTTLQKPSFWITTFLFPVIIIGISLGSQLIGTRAIQEAEENARSIPNGPSSVLPGQTTSQGPESGQLSSPEGLSTTSPEDYAWAGYVDLSGLIQEYPPGFPAQAFKAFPNQESAALALAAGQIEQYYLINQDFIESGELVMVSKTYNPLQGASTASVFEQVIKFNLVKQEDLGLILTNPTPQIVYHPLVPQRPQVEDEAITTLVTFGTMFIFFFIITSSSSFMLRSVTHEKENRMAEVLLVSIKPRQLMLGKVLGLGFVALLQMGLWVGGSMLAVNQGQALFNIALNIEFPPGFLFWTLLYFAFGYFMFGSVMGAIGALAPNSREANQFTFVVILPLLAPLWLNVAFIENPNGAVATFLSLFPLTAPISMVTRLASGVVPPWQPFVGLGLLALTTYFVVTISGQLFRADAFLSTDSLSWKRLFHALWTAKQIRE